MGIWHAPSLGVGDGVRCFRIETAIKMCAITSTNIQRAVITDPNDPKFDLEAYLTQVQKDNP